MSVKLVFRYPNQKFKSIENVFNTLEPFLKVDKVVLTYPSKGIINRIKNWRFVKKIKHSIIHVSGFDHYLLLFRKGENIILTVHDIEPLLRMKGLKRWVFKKVWFDIPIRNASFVTAISEFTKNELLKLGNYKTPIEVVYNPNVFSLHKKIKLVRKKYPEILVIGTKPNKNLVRICEAIKGIDCKLHVVGTLSPEQNSTLSAQNINYINHLNISKQELKELYSSVSLLCFPSTYEGFGLPIIEAQSLGCPVVTSNCSSMPEIAGKGAFFVDPFDATDISNGITQVLSNENVHREIIQYGYENVKRFEPALIAKQYQTIYEAVINA